MNMTTVVVLVAVLYLVSQQGSDSSASTSQEKVVTENSPTERQPARIGVEQTIAEVLAAGFRAAMDAAKSQPSTATTGVMV